MAALAEANLQAISSLIAGLAGNCHSPAEASLADALRWGSRIQPSGSQCSLKEKGDHNGDRVQKQGDLGTTQGFLGEVCRGQSTKIAPRLTSSIGLAMGDKAGAQT